MNFPLIVLAVLSLVGGWVVFQLPHALSFLTEVGNAAPGAAEAAHGTAEAAAGAEGAHHALEFPGSFLTWQTGVSVAAGLIGLLGAWFGMGPEKFAQGWSPAQEKAFGFIQETYEKALHGLVVKGGTAFSNFLFQFVDRLVIDGVVNGFGTATNFLADSLAGLQTGYVRNYALVMLAGAVFVGACFMWILQQGAQGALQKNLLYTLLGVVIVAVLIQTVASILAAREERIAASSGDTAA
jgi:NADH-quinone oxidoreductase subunit L